MKNKTKKIIKLLSVLLLVVVLQTMGYTYAKYIAEDQGTGYAEVAKWGFEIVKDGQETKTVHLLDTTDKETLVNGKIAPGTSGMITVELDASASEVDLEYVLEFTNEQNKPDNLFFTYQGEIYKSLSSIGEIIGRINYDSELKTKSINILWRWAYETGGTDEEKAANDIIDTQNANMITEYTFDIVATATQAASR